jgi:hypothetical protein
MSELEELIVIQEALLKKRLERIQVLREGLVNALLYAEAVSTMVDPHVGLTYLKEARAALEKDNDIQNKGRVDQ